jgi:hypothetical protein
LKFRDYFLPFSNTLLVVSFWFFWAQITAVSFVPDIRCWSREGDNVTASNGTWAGGAAGDRPQVMSAVVAEDVCSWLGETWRYLGRLLLFTIDIDFNLFNVDLPEFDLYIFQFWVSVSVAVIFPPLTRAYHQFFRAFRELQEQLNSVLSRQRRALRELEKKSENTEREREHASATENEITEQTRVYQQANVEDQRASLEEKTMISTIMEKKRKKTGIKDDLRRRSLTDNRVRKEWFKEQCKLQKLLEDAHARILLDATIELSRAQRAYNLWQGHKKTLWASVQVWHNVLLNVVQHWQEEEMTKAQTLKEEKAFSVVSQKTVVSNLEGALQGIVQGLTDAEGTRQAALKSATEETSAATAVLQAKKTAATEANATLKTQQQGQAAKKAALRTAQYYKDELEALPTAGSSQWLAQVGVAISTDNADTLRLLFTKNVGGVALDDVLKMTLVTQTTRSEGWGWNKSDVIVCNLGTDVNSGKQGPEILAASYVTNVTVLPFRQGGDNAETLASNNRKTGVMAVFQALRTAAAGKAAGDYSALVGSYESEHKIKEAAFTSAQKESIDLATEITASTALALTAKGEEAAALQVLGAKSKAERALLGSKTAGKQGKKKAEQNDKVLAANRLLTTLANASAAADFDWTNTSEKGQPVLDAVKSIRKLWQEQGGLQDDSNFQRDGGSGMGIFEGVAAPVLARIKRKAFAVIRNDQGDGRKLDQGFGWDIQYNVEGALSYVDAYLGGKVLARYAPHPAFYGYWEVKKMVSGHWNAVEYAQKKYDEIVADAGKSASAKLSLEQRNADRELTEAKAAAARALGRMKSARSGEQGASGHVALDVADEAQAGDAPRTLVELLEQERRLLLKHDKDGGANFGRTKAGDDPAVDGLGMTAFISMPPRLKERLKFYSVELLTPQRYDKHARAYLVTEERTILNPHYVTQYNRHRTKLMWESTDQLKLAISAKRDELAENEKDVKNKEIEAVRNDQALATADAKHKVLKKFLADKSKETTAAKTALSALEAQQSAAKVRAQISEQEEEKLTKDVFDCKAQVKAKAGELKKTSIDTRRCGFMYAFFDTFTAVLYMNVMRILAKALACTGYGSGVPEYLIALPEEECFAGWHRVVAPLALIGMMCLYPSAVLTRPLFQALDAKLNLRFNYNYLFVFAQIQTALLLCSAFFPNRQMFLLCACLIADISLVWYFKFHEPCTSTALNTCAYRCDVLASLRSHPTCTNTHPYCALTMINRAFGFSACVNVAAMVVLQRGDDYGPSVFLFVYVGWMIWLIICTIQDRWFSLDSKRYKFLKSPKPEQVLQIRMSMRYDALARQRCNDRACANTH